MLVHHCSCTELSSQNTALVHRTGVMRGSGAGIEEPVNLFKNMSSPAALAIISYGPTPVMWTAIVVAAAAALLVVAVVVVYIVSEGDRGKRARQLVNQILSRRPPSAPRRKLKD